MGKQPSIPQLLAALDAELGVWLGRWENGAGFAAIRSQSGSLPPLTTIRVATNDIGRMAVRLVLTQIRRGRGSITRLPTQLILRNSTMAH